jgi:hypothetical protein
MWLHITREDRGDERSLERSLRYEDEAAPLVVKQKEQEESERL